MPRKLSHIAPDWWDYTTLDSKLINDAAKLSERDLRQLTRPGFKIVMYDTLEDFYLAEALEYIHAWRQATPDNPVGICGPIGPTEQLPLVARLVNELGLELGAAHFWGMDEWYDPDTKDEVPITHPLSFEKADRELCFSRISKKLVMPDANLHFPKGDTTKYVKSWDAGVKCAVMQGGQGDIKHWAFNDPVKRTGKYKNDPPSPAEYRKLGTRVVELHPITLAQNARTSGGGNITMVPKMAITVSLLADHPNVQFNYFRGGLGTCAVEMH
jgi:glucosamine-6-phosphate deaminase